MSCTLLVRQMPDNVKVIKNPRIDGGDFIK